MLLQLLVVLKVDLFRYEVLLPRELLKPQVDGLLQILDLLLKLLDLLVEDLDGFLVLLVLLEHASQLLLLNHHLIQDGVVIHQVSSLQLCVPFEVLVLLLRVFYARTQGVRLPVQLVEQVGFGGEEPDPFVESAELIVIILKPRIVGFLLVLQQHESAL